MYSIRKIVFGSYKGWDTKICLAILDGQQNTGSNTTSKCCVCMEFGSSRLVEIEWRQTCCNLDVGDDAYNLDAEGYAEAQGVRVPHSTN